MTYWVCEREGRTGVRVGAILAAYEGGGTGVMVEEILCVSEGVENRGEGGEILGV